MRFFILNLLVTLRIVAAKIGIIFQYSTHRVKILFIFPQYRNIFPARPTPIINNKRRPHGLLLH